jgi:hypothetical protein
LRNRKISALENDGNEGHSHGLIQIEEIDCELEIPNNRFAIPA